MPGHYTFWGGSQLLTPVADALNLRIDQVNFVVSQLVSLPASLLLYFYFSPGKATRNSRLLFGVICGLTLSFFCFGFAIKHLLADAGLCYLVMRFGPKQYVDRLVFVVAMGYLSFLHFYRVHYAPAHLLDISGPMMVITQKMTSLAFSLHDGRVKKQEDLSPTLRRESVEKVPTVLEFSSYVFFFQGILCGPSSFYSDYMAFIEGRHYVGQQQTVVPNGNNNDPKRNDPSPWRAVAEKMALSFGCLTLNAVCMSRYPPEAVFDIDQGFFGKLWYVIFSMMLTRTQYYYAWVMADAIANASGFGFNGYAADGTARWDLISNVKIWQCETGLSLRETLEGWNCATMYWLRRVAYERVAPRYRTVVTYLVSAWWHGFFPGYYLTFVTGALFTLAARSCRKVVRPYFLASKQMKLLYDILTFVAARLAIGYAAVPFVLLHWSSALRIYTQLYFFMHIASVLLLVVVPRLLPSGASDKTVKSS